MCVIQGKIIYLTYLDDLNKTFSKQSEMNPETLHSSLYCILTGIHTASAVLSGPLEGSVCLWHINSEFSAVFMVHLNRMKLKLGQRHHFWPLKCPLGLKVSTEVRQRVDSRQSYWTECCGLKS